MNENERQQEKGRYLFFQTSLNGCWFLARLFGGEA
jgi:hypothetical protein